MAERDTTLRGRRLPKLYANQEGICAGCKRPVQWKDATVDHIVPLARGGTNKATNLQMLCGSCNCSKGAKQAEEWDPNDSPARAYTTRPTDKMRKRQKKRLHKVLQVIEHKTFDDKRCLLYGEPWWEEDKRRVWFRLDWVREAWLRANTSDKEVSLPGAHALNTLLDGFGVNTSTVRVDRADGGSVVIRCHYRMGRVEPPPLVLPIEVHPDMRKDYAQELTYMGALPSPHPQPDIALTPVMRGCLLYTSPSPRDRTRSRMPSSA